MKRLIIVVEGETEESFVDNILAPHLYQHGIQSVDCYKIKHSKGGLNKYQHLKRDLINSIYESNALVSTLIDFYALPKDFPGYEEAKKIPDKAKRLTFLENEILRDIEKEKGRSFPNLLPYIQLHEFEAFVFSSLEAIESLFDKDEMNFAEIKAVIDSHPNPEDINDSPRTAPSKRLKNDELIKGYNKILHGSMITEMAGIEIILEKCERFRAWVELLISKAKP